MRKPIALAAWTLHAATAVRRRRRKPSRSRPTPSSPPMQARSVDSARMTSEQRRNERCHCGSGQRYKHCHGAPIIDLPMTADLALLIRRAEAERTQRELQQGKGKGFISAVVGDRRFVAVGKTMMWGKWKTVPDFLMDYIKRTIGSDWGNAELAKTSAERHPLLNQYQHLCAAQTRSTRGEDGLLRSEITGATASYLGLAYNLYCLEHNAEVQQRLLHRLRNKDLFEDTRYEILVAGAFARAGFTLAHEDEDDGTTTHHEFIAKHQESGRLFSVECKRRNSDDPKNLTRIGRIVRRALSKHAAHGRVVFLDLNYPGIVMSEDETPPWLTAAIAQVHRLEDKQQGAALPSACIVLTNNPCDLFPDETKIGFVALRTSIRIPEMRFGRSTDLRGLIDERANNPEIHELMLSLRDHHHIPATFDGSIPQLAFGNARPRLLVGERYALDDGAVGTIVDAPVVMENEKKAYCILRMESGAQSIYSFTMTDDEIEGWRQHPTTFFGVVQESNKPLKVPLDYYEFHLRTLSGMSKEQLLAMMTSWPPHLKLEGQTRDELASLLAEARALQLLSMARKTD